MSNSYEPHHRAERRRRPAVTPGPWRLLANASYQSTRLRSEQTFPDARLIERTFDDVLPSMQLTGSFANRRNLRLAWNTSTNAPSISQLQNVVEQLQPARAHDRQPASCAPTYSHTLCAALSEADPTRSKSRFVFANVTRTSRPIANATFTAPARHRARRHRARARHAADPAREPRHRSWNANMFGVYSRPATALKSIVSVNGGGSLTRTPTRQRRDQPEPQLRHPQRPVVASNISPNLDFTVSYLGTYNISRSTLSTSTTGDYFTAQHRRCGSTPGRPAASWSARS